MIIKITNTEISISSANTVYGSKLCRVINTGASANLVISGVGNVTVSNTESIIVEKTTDATLTGANMRAAPISFRN